MSDMIAPPIGAPPTAPAADSGGVDWKALIQMIAPVVGGLAMGGGVKQTGFMQGMQQGQEMARQHREEQQRIAQAKATAGSDFLMRIGTHAQGIDDPIALHDFLRLAEDAGTKAGYVKPGDVVNRFQVSPNKLAEKRLTELTDQLDGLEKSGYNLDELTQAGATLKLKDGSAIPVGAAVNLARKRPADATGAPIAKPDKTASSEEERWIAQRAKDYGYASAKDVDADTQLQWRDEYRSAGRAGPAAPHVSAGGVDAQYADLVSLWEDAHPGQKVPAAVRTKLRTQANAVNDKTPNLNGRGANGLMPGQEFAISEKLAKTWQDTTKAQREMNRQFSLMNTGLKRFREGDKNGGSQGVLVTFQKILDPSSVVRESEYARSAAGISALGRIEGYMERLRAGGAGVPDGELSAMVETAKQFLDDMKGFNNGQRKRIEAQAKKYSIDPALIFDDVAAGGGDGKTSAGGAARVYYDANGQPVVK
jgi:hypothetical protein